MNTKIESYYKDAPPFAKPILTNLRKMIKATCPQVEEVIKWRTPFFMYRGKILCGTVKFKAHCALLMWNWKALVKELGPKHKAELKKLRRIESVKRFTFRRCPPEIY